MTTPVTIIGAGLGGLDAGPRAARPRRPVHGLRGGVLTRGAHAGRAARHPRLQRPAGAGNSGPDRRVPPARPQGRRGDAAPGPGRDRPARRARRRHGRQPRGTARRTAAAAARLAARRHRPVGPQGQRRPRPRRRPPRGHLRRRHHRHHEPARRRGRRLVPGPAAAFRRDARVHRHLVHRDLPVRRRPPAPRHARKPSAAERCSRSRPGRASSPTGRPAATSTPTCCSTRPQEWFAGIDFTDPAAAPRGSLRGVRRLGAGAHRADHRRRDRTGPAHASTPCPPSTGGSAYPG